MSFFSKILIFFLSYLLLSGFSNFVSAQGWIVCDEPIPIGTTLKDLADLINELYTELRAVSGFVHSAGEHMKGVITDLSQGGERICDYSKCAPNVSLQSPDFGFAIKLPFGKEIKLPPAMQGWTLPLCQPKKCVGEPCPDLSVAADTLRQLNNGIESSFRKLKKIILEEKIIVTEDLNKIPEEVGDTITQAEAIKRNLTISRLWLRPSDRKIDVYSLRGDKKEIIGKKSCALGVWEREQIAAGEIVGERFPMQCREALKQRLYWPRPWSELCHYQCKDGLNNECIKCLRNPKNNKETASILAKINYRIFNKCGNDCCKEKSGEWEKCEITKECYSCLCGGPVLTKKLENECLDWICGGSQANFICCHEAPMEFYVGFDKVIDVEPINDIDDGIPPGTISRSCAKIKPPSPLDCANYIGLASHYNVPFPRQNAPQLDSLITCLKNKSGRLGSILTYDEKHSVCNYTRGQKICGNCSHTACSCHYGGKSGQQGALAVDIGNEGLWNEGMQTWLEECQKAVKTAVCAIKKRDHIHISLPNLGNCDTGLITRQQQGYTTTGDRHPFKCWGI